MLDDLFNGLDPDTTDTFFTDDQGDGTTSLDQAPSLTSLQSSAPLSLGDLDFANFSTPTKVSYGVTQRHKVHELPGGDRVVDALGPAYKDITWRGLYVGTDRDQDREALQNIVIAGDPVTLAWGANNFDVLCVEGALDDHDGYTDYSITCVVLSIATVADDSPSDYASISDDVASAQDAAPDSDGYGDLASLSAVLSSVSSSSSNLRNPTITGLLQSASATMTQEVSAASQVISSMPALGSLDLSTADTITAIQAASNALATMTTSGVAAAYLNRSLGVIANVI